MTAINTVVIGAGHAGLAVSHLLGKVGRDHVVLDRGRVAESWRSERWDSLRLLTPRWMTRLPGRRHLGADQEGFMAVPELVEFLEGYAADSGAPLELGQEVLEVSQNRGRYQVTTSAGSWLAQNVVVASGPSGRAHRPEGIDRLGPDIAVLSSSAYRNPHQLPAGGVLVVGASASGTQIADELARAGRRVVLAVGSHTRMPRRYRGMDAFWWMEQTGKLARVDDGRAIAPHARREPSLQMAGRSQNDHRGADLDLTTLQDVGVELVGRLARVHRHRIDFQPDLERTTREADARLTRLLDELDVYVDCPAPRRRGRAGPAATSRLPRPHPQPHRPARRGHLDSRAGDRVPAAPPLAERAGRGTGRQDPPVPRRRPPRRPVRRRPVVPEPP